MLILYCVPVNISRECRQKFPHYLKQFLVSFVVIIVLTFKLFIMEIIKRVQARENGVLNSRVPINDLQQLTPRA